MALVLLLGMLLPPAVMAQVNHYLNSNGWMGLAGTNGKFSITVDDMEVKVPGGYVRINRDYDGSDWGFNRQWSGLGHPDRYQSSYVNLKTQTNCTTIDGVKTCDKSATASTNVGVMGPDWTRRAIIPGDIYFGRSYDMTPAPLEQVQWAARKGVMFERDASSADGTGSVRFTSTKYPRFTLMQQKVPALPPSTGPDAHPIAGRPGKGGVATREIDGYRWADRTGEWIEYDQFGRITSYGDRNDVRVWFQYGNQGQVERVLDDNGRTVFTLLYKDGGRFITEARDHTPIDGKVRRVQYSYDSDGFMTRVIDARGGTTRYEYDNTLPEPDTVFSGYPDYIFKKISKVIDAEGRPLAIEYGMTSRATKFTTADGGVTEFEYSYDKSKKEFSLSIKWPVTAAGRKLETRRYDVEGRLVYHEVNGKVLLSSSGSVRNLTYTDERGNATTVNRDAFDEVTKITYADGTAINYTYESSSIDLKEFADESGATWRFRRDKNGNVIERSAAAGTSDEQLTEYTRNARGQVERVVRRAGSGTDPGSVITLTRDANDNVTESVDGEGFRWTFTYDSIGNILTATDPDEGTWLYAYDAHGNLLSQTDPNQNTVTHSYDASGRIVSTTDGRGKTQRIEYDEVGRDTTYVDAFGNRMVDQFDTAGRMVSRTDAVGNSARLGFDASQRLVRITDGENFDTLYDYADVDGVDRGSSRPTKITFPTFQRQFRYSNRNRAVQQTEQIGTDTLVMGATHDARGNIRTLTNPQGHTQSFEYDALGRTTAVIDELGNAVRFTYDYLNNLRSVVDAKGKATTMQYDRRGLLVSETNPLGEITRYTYDDTGKQVELEHASGAKVSYKYDAGGRLVESQARGADGGVQATNTFSWDKADNLVGWTTDRASGEIVYDDADRLVSEKTKVDGVSLDRAYSYYANNKIRSYTGPDGVELTYAYDRNGELARIDIPGEGSIAVTDWQWTAPKKIVFPGGLSQEMERDGHQQLLRLRVRAATQNVLFELENQFGQLRELTSRTTDGRKTRFEYDETVRLIKEQPEYIGGRSETYSLDAAGNRIGQSSLSGSATFDDANRLISRGSVSYKYDAAGNVIERSDTAATGADSKTRFNYDAFNRLIEVRDGSDVVISRYAYDGFGQRLVKEVLVARNGASIGKTLYLQGEEGLLAEADAQGMIQRTYGWHPEHDYATYPLFQKAGGQYYYYHNDHLGTPWRVTNKAGAIVWSARDYTSFGEAKVDAGAQITQPWRFPGQYLDVETGLHYNLQRYYESSTGRYISEDPLGFDSDLNFYTYARHAPTNLTDPTGEIIPLLGCLAWNYLRCVAACSIIDIAGQALLDPCNIDPAGAIKECLTDCIWDMLPIPNPCGRLGKWAGAAMGVYEGANAINSFTARTPVATPDGLRAIEDLRPGDQVMAYAEWEGSTRVETITDVFMSHREQTIVTITLASGKMIEATGGHPLHTPTGWRAAQLLQAGGQLDVKDADGSLRSVDILRVDQHREIVPVYNLEVSHSHTFFVGEDGVLAHNAHGNSASSTGPQHGYDIFEKATGAVDKTGISGGGIISCGKNKGRSKRAQRQVNALNRDAGYEKFDSNIYAHSKPGDTRQDMLNTEKARADMHRANKQPMNSHKRP